MTRKGEKEYLICNEHIHKLHVPFILVCMYKCVMGVHKINNALIG